MTPIVITFLCILWSSLMDSRVLSADILREYENGRNEGPGSLIGKRENGQTLIEGDIIVSKREIGEMVRAASMNGERKKRQAAIGRKHRKWLKGVNYVFNASASLELENCFRKAAAAWERNTCINFKQGKASDYLFVTDTGCYSSYVGRHGGRQTLSLRSYCEKEIGRAIHEIGHALGLYHTSSRYDRNNYITVMPNTLENYPNEFKLITQEESENYGTEYDHGSIMHLGSNVHTPIMIAADENYRRTMGSQMLSFTDLWLINKHYGCLDKCRKKVPADCKNGGFPHPRKCTTECICPSGYGGKRCDKPANNGKKVKATDKPQILKDELDSKGRTGDYANRTYWIESPTHTVIEIEIKFISFFFASDGCTKAAVEIKTNRNQTLTGYRFCSSDDRGIKLRSHSNRVPIIIYNKYSWVFEVELEYHYVSENA